MSTIGSETGSWRARGADVLIFAVPALCALPKGTVDLGAWLGVLGASTAAWLLAGPRRMHPVLEVGLGLWGLALAASLIPMPGALLEVVSPNSAAVRGGTDWAPLHLAPGAGAFRLVRWAAIVAFAGACSARVGSASFRARLPVAVAAGLGLAIAAAGIQTGFEVREVLGIWSPRWDVRDAVLAPLLNPNHWAAYLALAGVVAVGSRRPLPFLVGVVAVTLVVLGPSRSGQLGLAVAAVAFVALSVRTVAPGVGWALGALGLGAIALGGVRAMRAVEPLRFVDTGEVVPGSGPSATLEAWPEVLRLVADHPLGVGAGAFIDVFTRYRTLGTDDLMAHAENLPLQLLADHGIVGVVLIGVVLTGLAACAAAASTSEQRLGAAALVGLAAHELFDFATHTGAVTLVAAALVVWILGGDERRSGVGVGAVLLAVLLAAPGLRDWRLDASIERWADAPRELEQRRPSSFVVAQELGIRAARAGDAATALRWMNRAQQLAPYHPAPRLWTARVLHRLGLSDQALVEYRGVLERNWRFQGADVVAEVAQRYDGVRPLVRLGGSDPVLRARIAWALFQAEDSRAGAVADTIDDDHPLVSLVRSRARILAGAPQEGSEWARLALERDPTPWLRDRLEAQVALGDAASGAR